ncbi:MAG: M23 family metallopeptidase, partial [Bifidobacteriaceae bacterium]|nr:M23 family metallopeptidase [Bifidobacteriaceae bacterium]
MGRKHRSAPWRWPVRESGRRLAAAFAASALLCAAILTAGPAAAKKDRDELESEREANLAKIDEISHELEGVGDKLAGVYISLKKTEAQLPVAQADAAEALDVYVKAKREHEQIVEDLKEAEDLQAAIQEEIVAAQDRAAEAKRALGEIARLTMMQEPLAESDLVLLLGATDLSELDATYIAADAVARTRAETLRVAQEDAATNKNREARLAAVADDIAGLVERARAALDAAEEAKVKAEDAQAELEGLIAKQQSDAQVLESQRAALEEQQQEIEARQVAIQSDLMALADLEKARAPDGGPPFTPSMFGWPLSSLVLTSPFGWRTHPILGTNRMHTGADFSAACGTPIYVTADGTVIDAY